MTRNTTRMAAAAALSCCSALLVSGCLLGPVGAGDAAAGFFADEVAAMGADAGALLSSGTAKRRAAATDTIKTDVRIAPFAYDETSGSWVRTATVSTSEGYERVRLDTVTFKDATGAAVKLPSFVTVETITYRRKVDRSKGADRSNVAISIDMALSTGGDTTLVNNGTMNGTFNGERIAEGKITDVTRTYENHRWGYPVSGDVYVDLPNFTYEITYQGEGSALAHVTNKRRDRVREISVQVDQS